MQQDKKLVISADDFGYTKLINKGIIQCVENGVVGAVSVMVDGVGLQGIEPLFNSNVSIGIHLVPDASSGNVVDHFDMQIKRFVEIFGFVPRFISVHWSSKLKADDKFSKKVKLASLVTAKDKEIYLRGSKSRKNLTLYADDDPKKTLDSLWDLLGSVTNGLNELVVHPGKAPDGDLESAYGDVRRNNETTALTSLKIVNKIKKEGISLVNYNDTEEVEA